MFLTLIFKTGGQAMSSTIQADNNAVGNNPLGYAPVSGLIKKYAIPSIISLLVTSAYNITDQIFIGNVIGMFGNAATNIVFPLITLTNASAQLIGIGTSANFNINMGAKKPEEAVKYISTGISLMSVLGLIIMFIILLLKNPILILCGATENIMPLAESYLGITALGLPFFLFTQAGSSLIRADGSPKYSMICTVAGAVLNIFLDWLFMLVFNMGIEGAAAATVIGQIVSFIICVRYFPHFKSFKIKFSILNFKLHYAIRIAKLGFSNFVNLSIMMLVNIVMNNTLAYYGSMVLYGSEIPLAVSGVIAKLNSILVAFSIGLAQGCQPILGYNMGAKNYARIKETYKRAITAAFLINILAFLAFQLFPRQIVSIFGTGNDLYFEFAERYMRIFLMMVFLFGVQPISVNYFTGTGNVRQGIILSLSRQGFILLPLVIVFPLIFGLDGVLYAGPIADSLACVLSFLLVYRNFKYLTVLNDRVNKSQLPTIADNN